MSDIAYHPDLPRTCPPQGVEPAKGKLYRAVWKIPPVHKDFLSHAERGLRCDDKRCESWGLSVWLEVAAAEHARELMPYMKKKFVIGVDVLPTDGVIKPTPTNDQPLHYTFWKAYDLELIDRCAVVLEPKAT